MGQKKKNNSDFYKKKITNLMWEIKWLSAQVLCDQSKIIVFSDV